MQCDLNCSPYPSIPFLIVSLLRIYFLNGYDFIHTRLSSWSIGNPSHISWPKLIKQYITCFSSPALELLFSEMRPRDPKTEKKRLKVLGSTQTEYRSILFFLKSEGETDGNVCVLKDVFINYSV